MSLSKLPVIFIAFANDKERTSFFLKNLNREKKALRDALKKVNDKLCEVLIETDVSIKRIWEVFQEKKYRGRICIFHFSGHADGFQLLLESTEGTHEIALGGGLVSFLSKQKGLKLVFLNGCATAQLALELTNAGIGSAIGTTSAIYDSVAAELAPSFYRGLAEGIPLERAWEEALDELETNTGSRYRGIGKSKDYKQGDKNWFLTFRDGASLERTWNLPDASGNPLFGLELAREYYNHEILPPNPYRGLLRYSDKQASLFFGRGQDIRRLFQALESKFPVILFYGKTGVGKSSLLDAGLLPRVKDKYQVIYIRRNKALGLYETFINNLLQRKENSIDQKDAQKVLDPKTLTELKKQLVKLNKKELTPEVKDLISLLIRDIKVKANINVANPLVQIWNHLEKEKKPLLVVLDQVEEAFTKPMREFSSEVELQKLCKALKELFNLSKGSRKSKIILSFRKEFQAEIEKELNAESIFYGKVFLPPLDQTGVQEVILGISSHSDLIEHYKTKLEPSSLDKYIAARLFKPDQSDSPIAPVLQLLLKRMWDKMLEGEERVLSKELFDQLAENLWLDDFLDNVISSLKENPKFHEAVRSGFVYDFLMFFVTEMTTAGQRTRAEISKSYKEMDNTIITLLITELINKQVLFELNLEIRTFGLIHDSLAPSIKKINAQSNSDVQKILRTLYNHDLNSTFLSADEVILFDNSVKWLKKCPKSWLERIKKSRQKYLKAIVKDHLENNNLQNLIHRLDEYFVSNPNSHPLLHKFLIARSKWMELDAGRVNSKITSKEYLNGIQHLLIDLGDITIGLEDTPKLKPREYLKKEHPRIIAILESKNLDIIFSELKAIIDEISTEDIIKKFSLAKARFTILRKKGLFESDEELNLVEEAQIYLELIKVCKRVGEIYGVDLFNKFITLENPLALKACPIEDQIPIADIKSPAEIESYLSIIKKEDIAKAELERGVIKLADLVNKLKLESDKIEKLKANFIELKTARVLKILTHEELTCKENKIIIDIYEILDNLIAVPNKNSQNKQNLTINPQLSIFEIVAKAKNEGLEKKNVEVRLTTLSPIISHDNRLINSIYIHLLDSYSKNIFASKLDNVTSPLNLSALEKDLDKLVELCETQIIDTPRISATLNLNGKAKGLLLESAIGIFLEKGYFHLCLNLLASWFNMSNLQNYKSRAEKIIKLLDEHQTHLRNGTLTREETNKANSRFFQIIDSLFIAMKNSNDIYFADSTTTQNIDIKNISQSFTKSGWLKKEEDLLKFLEVLNVDSLKEYLLNIKKYIDSEDSNSSNTTVLESLIIVVAAKIPDFSTQITLPQDIANRSEITVEIFKLFQANKLQEIFTLLEMVSGIPRPEKKWSTWALELENAEFEDFTLDKNEVLKTFKKSLIDTLFKMFNNAPSSYTEQPIEKIRNEFIQYIGGDSSLYEEVTDSISFLMRSNEQEYKKLLLLFSEISSLEYKERIGLVTFNEKLKLIGEVKLDMLKTFQNLTQEAIN